MSKLNSKDELRKIVKIYNSHKETYKDIFAKQISAKTNLKLVQRLYWNCKTIRDRSDFIELYYRLNTEYTIAKLCCKKEQLKLKNYKNIIVGLQKKVSLVQKSEITND